MNTRRNTPRRGWKTITRTSLIGAILALAVSATTAWSAVSGPDGRAGAGTLTAHALRQAALRDAREEFWIDLANCFNLSDPEERQECLQEAREDLLDAIELAWDQYWARMDLVAFLGEAPYDPEIEADDFVDGVDHPHFPLVPGQTLAYEMETDEGLERVENTVLPDTREVLGIECTVVHALETLDGEVTEETWDWYAQDEDGNVWYFGELSFEWEDGEPVNMDGSWESGEDGAKPGIIAFADPVIGTVYRQEFLAADAEDVGRILALDETVTIGYGTFDACLHTEDWSPLEPGIFEQKYYAPGVGVVLEVDMEGNRLELVEILP